jgi:3-hydroxy-9,10-secoandrosta-1,3,5(10)-triene-9,17-dione monooxygenase reductase component
MPDTSSDAFRRVLGHLPTGVTVITGFGPDGPTGMAATSVTSVSLDPPLILFCPAKSSTTWPRIRQSGSFCVNVMAGHHENAVRQFAVKNANRFEGISWSQRACGPAIDDAIAWLECEIADEHDAGDHTIVVGAVTDLRASADAVPLVFFRGGYGRFIGDL